MRAVPSGNLTGTGAEAGSGSTASSPVLMGGYAWNLCSGISPYPTRLSVGKQGERGALDGGTGYAI